MENMRRCPRCKQTLPETAFLRNKITGRFQPYCRTCTREYKRVHKGRPETVRAAQQRRAATPEYQAFQAKYRAENRQRLNEMERDRRRRLGETLLIQNRARMRTQAYRARVKERRQERLANEPGYAARIRVLQRKATRTFYAKNKASVLTEMRAKYHEKLVESRERSKKNVYAWNARNPEKVRALQHTRKAVRRGAVAVGFDEFAHFIHLSAWQQNLCYHCDAPLIGPKQIDHLVPIKRGGQHEAGNLAWTCGACNASKHAKLLWREWQPRLRYDAPLLLRNAPAIVVSTFAASERGRLDARRVLVDLRAAYPGQPLFFDYEWLRRQTAVANLLSARSGGDASVVGGRQTTVVRVDSEDARAFLNDYHLQGFGRGSLYLGLQAGGELVGCSAWLDRDGLIELNRLAFKGRVVGGFSKMLHAFRKEYAPSGVSIASFSDSRYATGDSYVKLGFRDVGETALPVYYYVGPSGIFHRRSFTRDAQKARFILFDDTLTEWENARVHGYYRVFGLPQRRFLLPG